MDKKHTTADKYNPAIIESKWQKVWEKEEFYQGVDFDPDQIGVEKKPKFYTLIEFPYPSGAGLHVGHVRSWSAMDAYSRKKRMQGFNVLYPIGWDAFGLPAENYAIKNKIHPSIAVEKNIATFKRQIKSLGLSFDWSREVNTTDPKYYKWTQWIFLQFFKKGLAYQADVAVNWCPNCKTNLADEEVLADGSHERCGCQTEKRMQKQWLLKITAYADRLIKDLKLVDFSRKISIQQEKWIGESKGARVRFKIDDSRFKNKTIEVFTTRPDTLFGATFIVLAPEHPLVETILKEDVKKYVEEAEKKTDIERTEEKTGVFSGLYVINPVNSEKIPIWIADYVLMGYGTGAIMAVPAHDQRDHDFAIKYKLPIIKVIEPYNEFQSLVMKKSVKVEEFKRDVMLKGMYVKDYYGWGLIVTGGDYAQNDYLEILHRHLLPGPWYVDVDGSLKAVIFKDRTFTLPNETDEAFRYGKEIGIPEEQLDWQSKENYAYCYDGKYGKLINSGKFNNLQVSGALDKLIELFPEKIKKAVHYHLRDWVFSRQHYWGEPIPIVYCPSCAKIKVSKGDTEISASEVSKGETEVSNVSKGESPSDTFGTFDTFAASRIIDGIEYAIVPVPEKDLPVELPYLEKYEPSGTGESPLAKVSDWVNVVCPVCGGKAKRETDTMPNWAGSNWYYLAYLFANKLDLNSKVKNQKSKVKVKSQKDTSDGGRLNVSEAMTPPRWNKAGNIFEENKDVIKYWMPVDLYQGGFEHTTLHLLYSRFVYKFLYDIKAVPTPEPYAKRRSHGIVLGPDGRKMSKSFGNVINPDEIVNKFGADTLRVYEMFMGPFEQTIAWSEEGVEGCFRFLKRVWQLANTKVSTDGTSKELSKELNKTIKKVGEDLENMKFNTAVACMMEFINSWQADGKGLEKNDLLSFLLILSPFAPHLSEELYQIKVSKGEREVSKVSNGGAPSDTSDTFDTFASFNSIHLQSWPAYNSKLLEEEEVVVVVQVNGKVRETLTVESSKINPPAGGQSYVEDEAKKSEKVSKQLEGKSVKKVIYVEGKIINFVTD